MLNIDGSNNVVTHPSIIIEGVDGTELNLYNIQNFINFRFILEVTSIGNKVGTVALDVSACGFEIVNYNNGTTQIDLIYSLTDVNSNMVK